MMDKEVLSRLKLIRNKSKPKTILARLILGGLKPVKGIANSNNSSGGLRRSLALRNITFGKIFAMTSVLTIKTVAIWQSDTVFYNSIVGNQFSKSNIFITKPFYS